jgi:hypothetical protein
MQPKFQSHEKNTHDQNFNCMLNSFICDQNFKGVLQKYTQLKFSIVC